MTPTPDHFVLPLCSRLSTSDLSSLKSLSQTWRLMDIRTVSFLKLCCYKPITLSQSLFVFDSFMQRRTVDNQYSIFTTNIWFSRATLVDTRSLTSGIVAEANSNSYVLTLSRSLSVFLHFWSIANKIKPNRPKSNQTVQKLILNRSRFLQNWLARFDLIKAQNQTEPNLWTPPTKYRHIFRWRFEYEWRTNSLS